ncbi:MAG: sporulation integral membrane protein YlbJ [Desulfocucumaceae bacterium]
MGGLSLAVALSLILAFFLVMVVKRSGYRPAPGQLSSLFWTVCALGFAISMISQPKEVFAGATMGLKTWWNIVFPSLLPFFIASELLMSFGLVNFIGIMMEPLMRPLFNVPGCGSFVLCIGYTSGFPIGAMVTARLRSQKLCTRIEAERLVSFTSNSSPLFMTVAVSVGMFGRPDLAVAIAGAHYLSNLTIGLAMRFYGRNDREVLPVKSIPLGSTPERAFRELASAWGKESRPLGKIIGDAVRNAINSLFAICGFIILFAVIIRLISVAGLISLMAGFLSYILSPLGFSPEIMTSLASGFFEMTIGCKMVCETSAPLLQQVAAVEILLAWSGLSVIAQVAGMISETDIRILPFIIARAAHSFLAALYTIFLFGPSISHSAELLRPATATLERIYQAPTLIANFELSGVLLLLMTTALLLLSAVFFTLRKVRIYF